MIKQAYLTTTCPLAFCTLLPGQYETKVKLLSAVNSTLPVLPGDILLVVK